MLTSLHIENIAVIKELDIDFSRGFSVMTGETGAGKSIIIGSVRLLLGARTDKDVIRTGETSALVEGLFSGIDGDSLKALAAEDVSPDENGELLLRRTVTTDGRSVCKINGRLVTQFKLRTVGQVLIGIHGQHDTQNLLNESTHLSLLDRYGGCDALLETYQTSYRRSMQLKTQLSTLMKEEKQRSALTQQYKSAAKEISEAKLNPGDEEKYEQQKKLVRDAQKLVKQARIVYRALYKNEKGGSASDLIEIAQTALEQLESALPESGDFITRLTACKLELEEIARSASVISEICTDNPTEELNRIEDRLDLIRQLKKKYGSTLEEVLAYKDEAEKNLIELCGREEQMKTLHEELERSVEEARKAGAALSEKRKAAAAQLEITVNEQVRYLDLEKVVFKVEVTNDTVQGVPKLTASGIDSVRFLISSNPGEPPKPVSDIASGGELSRIMLALKVALADKESTPSLVFDEIDTGISGKTSQKIGIKLREIAAYTQVFCITHSAQVAACGHHHFKISKNEVDGMNRTSVEELDRNGRIDELSRIMGGIHITDTVRASAEELLADGQGT